MNNDLPLVWMCGPGLAGEGADQLARALKGRARLLTLGPGGGSDLALGPEADLGLALEACPPGLRPRACACLGQGGEPAPPGLDGLPCPVLGWGREGPEGRLADDPATAAGELLAAARAGLRPAWMERVQVNMPLMLLLDRYRPIVAETPLHLEIGIDFMALDRLGQGELDQARALVKGRRVTVHLPFGDLAPGSPDPRVAAAAVERLEAAANWALFLGARQAVMHLGLDSRMHPDGPAYAQRLARALGPMAVSLNRGGCRLALENVFESGPEALLAARLALEEQGAPRVGFCLDVGHAQTFSATGLESWLEALAGRLFELHLHDNDGLGDHHLPPGRGRTDWAWLGRRIQGLPQAPVLTLEPHREPDLWASLRALEDLWGRPQIDTGPGERVT